VPAKEGALEGLLEEPLEGPLEGPLEEPLEELLEERMARAFGGGLHSSLSFWDGAQPPALHGQFSKLPKLLV
jgi:hypothetical protein